MHILADHSIANLDRYFPPPFSITRYINAKDIPILAKDHSILLCRSTLKVNALSIEDYPFTYIGTLSSGMDHLDLPYLHHLGTAILHAKGCNATSVVDYTTSVLAFLQVQHDIRPLQKRATSSKVQGGTKQRTGMYTEVHEDSSIVPTKQFADVAEFPKRSIKPHTIGIIGAGSVGQAMHTRFTQLGIPHVLYDPLRADTDSGFQSCSLETLYQCNILCLCANLHNEGPYPSRNLINKDFIQNMRQDAVVINTGRGELVDEAAIIKTNKIVYCTDVFHHEPNISKAIVDYATLCTPHIAGHSVEGKANALALISKQLHALYGLPISKTKIDFTPAPLPKNWQKHVLSQYNPYEDTQTLKNAPNLGETFLTLRKQHLRHGFK
jgi:erythronate-4-phosphate dehydrogenase